MRKNSLPTAHLKIDDFTDNAVCGLLGPRNWMPVVSVWGMTGKQYYLQEDMEDERVLCSECANHPLVLLAELRGAAL
jgi:hypothetical protein